MNRFLYFLPNLPGCNPQALASRGLLSRFSDRGALLEHINVEWREGPGGLAGCCVALGVEIPEYSADAQIWIECDGYWLGMTKGLEPGPDDLERPVGYVGHSITLLDGREWRVPLLRRWDGSKCEFTSALPKVMRPVPDAAGVITIKPCVSASCRALDDMGAEICRAFCAQEQWDIKSMFEFVSELLGENYRIADDEVGLLGLINEELGLRILGLSIDEPGVAQHAALIQEDGLHFAEGASHG